MKLTLGFLAAGAFLTNVALAAPGLPNGLDEAGVSAGGLMKRGEASEPHLQSDVFDLIHGLSTHIEGAIQLGDDGVLRSYHSNGTVIDYVKLTNQNIQDFIHRSGHDDSIIEEFKGVSGHDVTDMEQILHPNQTFTAGGSEYDKEERSPDHEGKQQ
ncbi:pisatin demethylase [Physcia stellaris]|nr:pisatin demethylase [Physcia stellaris]